MSERGGLLAGWLCASLVAHSVQLLIWRWAGVGPLGLPFVGVHFAVILAAYGAAALACRGLRLDRAWPGVAGALPVAAAVHSTAGGGWLGAGLSVATLALGLGLIRRSGLGTFAAALLGAASAGVLRYFRVEHYEGRHTPVRALLLLLGLLVVALVSAALAQVVSKRLRPAASLALWGLALPAAALWLTVDPHSPRRPAGTRPAPDAPPVVVIVLDTVRADHLRAYGYERDTMPRLERFADSRMVRVERSVANSSWTIPTHASLFTGLVPPRHGAGMGPLPSRPSESRSLREDNRTLAELLAARGYWTAAISANHVALREDFGFARGFASYRSITDRSGRAKLLTPWSVAVRGRAPLAALDAYWPFEAVEFFEAGVPYRRAPAITDEALAFLDRAGQEPFFLFLNYMDAHWPYRAPGAHKRHYGERPASLQEGWTTPAFEQILGGDRDMTRAEREELVNLYDGELSFLDQHLGRFLSALEAHPRRDEIIVVVTADHGEVFGEHRLVHHGRALYEELLRTPLFIKPGRKSTATGRTLPGPMQSVDIFATVLELAGLPAPPHIDGLPWGRGRTAAFAWVDPDEAARANPARFDRSLRSIERDRMKLIESSTGEPELYDLSQDPGETRNLAGERPEVVASLQRALGPWQTVAATRHEPTGALDAQRVDELRALGYIQ